MSEDIQSLGGISAADPALAVVRRGRTPEIARERRAVRILDETYLFQRGDPIHTENSYKFTPAGTAEIASRAGYSVE